MKTLLLSPTLLALFAGLASVQVLAIADEQALTAEKLFDPRHIVNVEIELPKEDWDAARMQTRSLIEALGKELAESPFTYVKGDVTIDGVLIKDVGIRKKGFLGSLDDQRPSLKVKFAEYEDQHPVAGLDRLTLNNNKQDPSGLMQYLAYKFFNASGTFASRCNLARVTVNGKYLGIYSNVESLKPPMLQRGFGDEPGALYEGTVADFYEDFIKRFEKKNKRAKYKPLRQIADILAEEEVDLAELEKLIDIEAFVKFWATESLLGFWDGYNNNQNNFFMYRSPANDKFYFIPWGADAVFSENMPLPPFTIRPRFVYSQSLLANRLYRIPRTQQLYHDTLNELLKEHWNETKLLAEIDRVEALLKDHIREENKQVAGTILKIRSFIETRRERIMEEMEDGPVELQALAKLPVYTKEIGKVTAAFTTKWYDKTPPNPKELGEVEIELELNGERIEFNQIGAYSEHSKFPPLPPGTPKPPAIIFTGQRKSNGKEIILGMGLPIERFHPTEGESVEIGGILLDGGIVAMLSGDLKMMGGKASFEKAAMKDGAIVKGRVELAIVQMSDGKQK
jgi:hypothetical protein